MRKLLFLIACLCVSMLPAFGQGVRIGDNPQVTTSPVSGGQLSAVANANISFCAHPANAVPCTNKVTTYTDLTLTTACPTSTQVVLAGTNVCVANSDGLGNWGVFVSPGNYDYTIQLPGGGSIGPYVVTLSGATALLSTTNLWTGSNTFVNGLFVGSPPLPVPGFQGPFTIGDCATYLTLIPLVLGDTPCAGGGGGSGTVVASPQFQLGAFPTSGSAATIQGINITTDGTGNNLFVPGNLSVKGRNPYFDITQYGARAVTINTTGTGSGTALTVGVTSFINGDGITIAQGGTAPVIAAPAGLAVATGASAGLTTNDVPTVAGMTGAATYNYQIFAVDILGGATVPTSPVTTTTGPTALGKTQFTVSTWSLTGNTLTIVTSVTSGLPVGTEVHTTGTSNNALAGGWYTVNGSSGGTLTFNNVPQYAATTTSGTGGTLTAFVGNALTWTRSTGGTLGTTNVVWDYYVCAERPGDVAYHIIGRSYPSTFYQGGIGYSSTRFVDFGPTLASNPIIPWYLSDANCTAGAAQNELFSTTVASGGGTTSLTLASGMTNAVTSMAVRRDDAPALNAAETAALNGGVAGGSIYIPLTATGTTFSINSVAGIPGPLNIWQDGTLTLNEPVIDSSSVNWFGDTGASAIPAFGWAGTPVINCNAWPCIWVAGFSNQGVGGTTFKNITPKSTQNGLLFLVDANWGMTWNYINFSAGQNNNDNMGIGLMIRPGAASYSIQNSNFVGGPNQVIDQTWAPLFYADQGISGCCSGGANVGNIDFFNTQWNRRGIYYLSNGGDGAHINITERFYRQGGITPMLEAHNINGTQAGNIQMDYVLHDTESQPAYVQICNLACATGSSALAFHLGNANQVSVDAGTIPGQVSGNGAPINQVIAQAGPGALSPNASPGFNYQQGRITPNFGIQILSGIDFSPNVPTPELTLENGAFTDNLTSLASANRTKFMPDAGGQVCVTGLVGCKYFLDTGTANVYVITPANPTISALVDGMDFTIKPLHANTGASTLQVGSTAAAAIKKNGVSTDPVANDILPKYDFEVKWDASDSVWLLTSNPGNGGGGGGSGTVNNSAAANNAAYYAGIGTTVSPIAVGSLSQFEQGVDSGAANVYVITDTPPVTFSASQYTRVYVTPTNSNTGNSTVAVDANGAIPLVKVNSANLINGDFVAGALYELRCLTTACFLMNPSSLTGVVPIALGGTGQTIPSSAFNALAPATANGGLIVGNGTNQYGNLGIGANGTTLTSNGTTASWTAPSTLSGSGVSGQVSYWNGTSTQTGSANFTFSAASGMSLQQGANNTTMLYGARFTDTAPTGFFEQYQNAAKNTNIWTVDASGNVVAGGSITSGTSLAVHMIQIPEGTVTGCAAGFDAISANSTIHRLQICNNNGSFVNAVVSGADINTSDQVATTHLTGMSTGAIPKVSATGGLVTGALSDNATNVTSTEDLDFVANSHNNECVNDVSTGTTNGLLMKFTSTGCITITTSDTAIPVFIVKRGGATSGSNQFIDGGIGPCKMDTTVASNARGYYVIASASVTGDCTPQAAAPAVGTYIVGQVSDNSTASGATALVDTTSRGYYTAAGVGTGTVTSIATTAPLGGGTITTTGTLTCTTCVTSSSPGAGIAHFAGSTQAVTSSAVVGADMTNNTVTATQLAAQYSKWEACNGAGLGDGLNAIPAGTYLQFTCVNTTGVTVTLTGLSCWTDNAGSSTMAAANNAGTALLTGAVTCNSTKSGGGNAGTQSATTTLANNDAISFTFVADGTSKQTNWTVKGTY